MYRIIKIFIPCFFFLCSCSVSVLMASHHSAYVQHDSVLSPPPLISMPKKNQSNLPLVVILLLCALGTAFLVVCYLTFVKKYYSNSSLNNSRRRNPPILDDDQEYVDENHGPLLDHPIWYIRTVGLQQSVIDSIAIFKYRRAEALTEGTDCSVCLNEFQEDETLRLLPKCSHAFHITCIDTWLRSHKNCPLCRAPIVCENARMSGPEANSEILGPREESLVEEGLESVEGHQAGGNGSSEIGIGNENFGGLPSGGGRIPENLRKDSRVLSAKNCEIRVLSDLVDHRTRAEEELQPVRRSVSLDASSASRVYLDVANISQLEGSSSTRLVQAEKPKSVKVGKLVVSRSLSITKPTKSSSMRFSLPSLPVAVKRSFSFTGKSALPRRYSRSQDSVLPL